MWSIKAPSLPRTPWAVSASRIAVAASRQPTHIREHEIARRDRSEEEPVAAPGDVSAHGSETSDFDRDRLGKTIALDILDRRRAAVDELHADRSDRRLEAMAPRLEPAHIAQGHGKADRAVAAHAEISDIVEEDDAGGA